MGDGLMVEIIAFAPTAYYHCTHCEVAWREMGVTNHIHEEQVDSSLPPDLAREYQEISDWVRAIFNKYNDKITVKVIDAASLEGFAKSLRHGLHHYPAVIVGGKAISTRDRVLQAADETIAHLTDPSFHGAS